MAKKKKVNEEPAAKAVTETIAIQSPKPTSEAPVTDAPVRKKKSKRAAASDVAPATNLTLEDLAAKYLAHLEDAGKSNGTLFSYKLELVTALDELGRETKLADLTPARVLEFFTCDRVMTTKSGVAKARPTFLKTQRVLRLALQWAQDSGLIGQAPVPEQAATF